MDPQTPLIIAWNHAAESLLQGQVLQIGKNQCQGLQKHSCPHCSCTEASRFSTVLRYENKLRPKLNAVWAVVSRAPEPTATWSLFCELQQGRGCSFRKDRLLHWAFLKCSAKWTETLSSLTQSVLFTSASPIIQFTRGCSWLKINPSLELSFPRITNSNVKYIQNAEVSSW